MEKFSIVVYEDARAADNPDFYGNRFCCEACPTWEPSNAARTLEWVLKNRKVVPGTARIVTIEMPSV